MVFPQHEVDQDANYLTIFSKQWAGLLDAQSRRIRDQRDKVCIACETVEFFGQNSLDISKIA